MTCDEVILQQNDYFWPCTNRFHIAVGGEHSGTKSIFSLHFLPYVNRLQYTLVFTDDSRISVKSVHMFTCVSHICIVISGDSSKCMRKAKMCIIISVEFSMQTDLALSLVGKSLNYWLKKCSHVYISCVPRYALNSPGEI